MTVGAVARHPVPAARDIEWINARVLAPDDHGDAGTIERVVGARLGDLLAVWRAAAARPAERTRARLNRTRHRYVLAFGQDRAYSPRVSSLVEHRVGVPAGEVVRAFGRRAPADPGPAGATDPSGVRFREPVTLHLAWSWPPLPLWLAVIPHSASVAVVSLELRSRRRVRYPRRYFSAAHTLLDGIAALAAPPSGLAGRA